MPKTTKRKQVTVAEWRRLIAERDAVAGYLRDARHVANEERAAREAAEARAAHFGASAVCAFCSEVFAREGVSGHMLACKKHPMRAVEAERDGARTCVAELTKDLAAAKAERNAEAGKVELLAKAMSAMAARIERAEATASAWEGVTRAQADLVAALSEPVKPVEFAGAK